MPLEPLDTHFEEHFGAIQVDISSGRVKFRDTTDDHVVYMHEEDLGKLMDKWMLARLAMNKRKTEGRYEKSD